jgi:cytochrome P450
MLRLPMTAVGEIMGIPEGLWTDIPRWAMAGVAPADPDFAMGSQEQTLSRAHYELFALFSELIKQRRRRPGDDLISVLISLDFGGRRMDEQQVLVNCYSFLMGAVTTTPHVASHMLLGLIEQPQAWSTVRARPSLVRSTVEEALRWASPTNHLMRRVVAPHQFGDVRLEPGELVCAWVASANRDSSVFAHPYRFDPARSPNRHLALGAGVHRCIGGWAAQVALAFLVEEMTARLDGFELAGDVTHLYSNFINGITHLPVKLHPRQLFR